ncbi:DUF1292 domain-containing protein [Desertibacillus haloalkaliphilus]|uniref:DUF1292 domain-containing protein n=1 Tax=Desertibacillus haloalkaliphilus TaxID=1328930 RepID=UPI001C27C021|nr:DUF1292 domain-containing protein [Desertibacillus haloalkaliphilus]MBU8907703.1 DUF1292 domain-containing protein [Desertibacillus haloalkaliphilus]
MEHHEIRDQITIEDEQGNEKEYNVEALFDMKEQSYALLSADDETVLMRVEDDEDGQYLIGVTDDVEKKSILNAYEVAVEANPADETDLH